MFLLTFPINRRSSEKLTFRQPCLYFLFNQNIVLLRQSFVPKFIHAFESAVATENHHAQRAAHTHGGITENVIVFSHLSSFLSFLPSAFVRRLERPRSLTCKHLISKCCSEESDRAFHSCSALKSVDRRKLRSLETPVVGF